MTRSAPRFRPGPGVLVLPTRLSGLSAQINAVLELDEIKTTIINYNRRYKQTRVLGYAPESGWCADCQSWVESGQVCGCGA